MIGSVGFMNNLFSPLAIITILAAPFIGSFLGLLVDRLPLGRPVLLGRSACENCGHTLGPLDLVPFASWTILKGRCRYCRYKIGHFYPLIELAAVVVALWSALVVPADLLLFTVALGWALLCLALIDARHMYLPDVLTLPLLLLGLILASSYDIFDPVSHGIGALLGAVAFALVRWVYFLLRGIEGLGLGDVKLFAAAGAWLGWQGLPSVLLIAGVTGLIFALIKQRGRQTSSTKRSIAFGPFLATGVWITWLYGPLTLF